MENTSFLFWLKTIVVELLTSAISGSLKWHKHVELEHLYIEYAKVIGLQNDEKYKKIINSKHTSIMGVVWLV